MPDSWQPSPSEVENGYLIDEILGGFWSTTSEGFVFRCRVRESADAEIREQIVIVPLRVILEIDNASQQHEQAIFAAIARQRQN